MNITFIGGGNMASAMIGGLLSQGWDAGAIRVVEVAAPARERLARDFKVTALPALTAGAAQADCIVLAVKPQVLREVALGLRAHLHQQLIITIAAGIRLSDLGRWLGGYGRLVRVMPNTPALVLAGVSALYAQAGVGTGERAAVEKLLGSVGATVWLEREDEIDAVTAVSGSGPAYVFYFMEALEQAARELGLPVETARKLVLETFSGAARLAAASADPPATLRERVTSRAGTTEKALLSMEADRIKDGIVRAVRAAAARSRELGEELGKD